MRNAPRSASEAAGLRQNKLRRFRREIFGVDDFAAHLSGEITAALRLPNVASDRAMRSAALFEIALMIFFGAIEFRRRFDLRHDRAAKPAAFFQRHFRCFGCDPLFG